MELLKGLLMSVPMIDSSSSPISAADENDQIAKTLTSTFSDWAFAFLDRIITLISFFSNN